MITVMGATGNTGKKITEKLLNVGENIRALGRSENKLAELKNAGAEVLIGDTNDAAFLSKAFRGAAAVYTLLPTDPSSHVEMTRAFNEEKIKPSNGRTLANTTPTRFEDFASELAQAYAAV